MIGKVSLDLKNNKQTKKQNKKDIFIKEICAGVFI